MDKNLAYRVSIVSIIVNIGLSLFKAIAGIMAKSGAMISDAVHSASDVFSTVVVMIGIKISSKEADKEHPYGHERMECIAAIILAFILMVTGIGIGWGGLKNIIGAIKGESNVIAVPGVLALAAAVVSIAVKEAMYWYTRSAAKNLRSDALMADAWHHRSDALSSIGSFAGIFTARMGLPVMDSIASVIICLFIAKAAWNIASDAIDKTVDKSCCPETVEEISNVITAQDGVMGLADIKTRMFGSRLYVDIIIEADGTLPLNDAHDIAESVHDAVEHKFPDVKHCMVHVNPYDYEKSEMNFKKSRETEKN